MRVQFLTSIMSNALTLPMNNYPAALETAAELQISQLRVNIINILFVIFRFFKLYKFQDQLRELTDTFSAAWIDLYHFFIMFLLVFTGFSLIGHIMFGQQMFDYSSVIRAFVTQFEMMMNNYDYTAMSRISPIFAPMFLSSFVFIASICLINILVAILMDAYDAATDRPYSRSIVEQLAIIASRADLLLGKKLEPLKEKLLCQSEAPVEHVSDNDDNEPPPKLVSTADLLTVLTAKKEAMKAENPDHEEGDMTVQLEDLTKFAATVLPDGGPSGFDLSKKMCPPCACCSCSLNPAFSLVCSSIFREAEEFKAAPRIDEKLFQIEARAAVAVPPSLSCSAAVAVASAHAQLQVDLVRRENERLNRQIEILSSKFKAKASNSNDVIVREGWLDKRSDHLHHANVRPALPLFVAHR